MGNRLAGKVVVVTGGTKGIGKGIALMCASEAATVVVNGRNEQDGARVVQTIQETYCAEALFVKADISREKACKQLIDEAVGRFGKIDGLVNNAGIFPRGTMVDTSEELFDSIFAVNMKGAFFCSMYAIQSMLKTGGGSIVHMGSTNGYKGGKELAAYSCSKGALLTLNRHIAAHYAREHIRSNWVTVGWVASEGEIELYQNRGLSPDELMKMGESYIPSGRMQTPEDMAHGTIFLLSDEASQVTGTELHINGGLGL
ncbi:glucose 1-dehydrogenase [Paenibacillus alginolyticus]|uniref:Glucose 1-dehydrogenase n=1 Tax=Paenibacillus alginolyticus TaxID=59839 RepID=A0ABT4GCE5_9BACL|nr:glucose 1-dehydrogenase [Paenibacillus alginolyticus]MCY9664306.1 glucose 1-dehydrogenase [Paenibacillus alginolyticus]MCY9693848.1 glucose 1-dehydrogenase [Paenibacillus alginolyticus]MEC0148183.1 glucose 1-dehydrogenase [Paenibacillus alginolyticus]